MKSRPATKRREPSQPASPFRYRGLWRDEKLLVVDLAEHQFPRRCLKTNNVVDQLEQLTLTYYGPSSTEMQILRNLQCDRVRINVIEVRRSGSRALFTLPVPLSPWLRTIWHSPWGRRLIWIGAAALPAALVGSWFNAGLGLFCLATGLLSILIGGVFQLALRWVLPVHRVCEGKIWIGGVHRTCLQRLPKFVPSRSMLVEEIRLLHASLWICFWVGVFFVGLVLFGNFAGELSKPGYKYVGYALLTATAVAILIGNRARLLLRTAKQRLAALDPPKRRR